MLIPPPSLTLQQQLLLLRYDYYDYYYDYNYNYNNNYNYYYSFGCVLAGYNAWHYLNQVLHWTLFSIIIC